MQAGASGSVIVISSHVVRGTVGNRAAVFALERLGFPVWALPTIVLPWHPGHGPSTRLNFPAEDFDRATQDLAGARWRSELRGVLTGYFASVAQVEAAAALIRSLKNDNPDLIYLCDPVMGDKGGLYIPLPVAEAIRDLLIPLADIATPNRHELGFLTGSELETNARIMDAALSLGPPHMLVTSAIAMMAGGTGNLFLSGRSALLAEHRLVKAAPNGVGDLLSAVYLARWLEGHDEERRLQLATASVFEVVARSVKRGSDELTLERDADCLVQPMAMVQLRRLMHPAQQKGR